MVVSDNQQIVQYGLLAQLGERYPCKVDVESSILLRSTNYVVIGAAVQFGENCRDL